jgi:hypothetical protein
MIQIIGQIDEEELKEELGEEKCTTEDLIKVVHKTLSKVKFNGSIRELEE